MPNPFDAVKPAGRKFVGKDESVEYCLKDAERPPTPEKVKQFKTTTQPGERTLHPGYKAPGSLPQNVAAARAEPDGAVVFGTVPKGDKVHASDVLNTQKSRMEEYINSRAEQAKYLSRTREPLGKTYVAGSLKLPDRTQIPDFKFGAAGANTSESAKATVFPVGADPEEEKKEEVYQKSHRSYPPGMQRRTAVVWSVTGVDPESTRFGRPQVSKESNVVGKCLNPDEDEAHHNSAKTVIVPKVVDDFRLYEDYRLGETRGKRLTDRSNHPEVYGRAATKREGGEWGAADCLQGDYHREAQSPDRDLGRAVTLGYRHAGMAADPNRRFGLPSVRTDVPPRAGDSLANYADYGNGPSAASLLFPGPYAEHGVDEKDFAAPKPPSQLRKLFDAIGYQMSDAEFWAIYNRASQVGQLTPLGAVSLQEFRDCMNEVLSARDAGEEPSWFTAAVDGPQ